MYPDDEVDNNEVGYIIGKGGATIRRIQGEAKIGINVPKRNTQAGAGTQTVTITLTGPPTKIDHARRLIQQVIDSNQTDTMVVHNSEIGHIVGKKGSNIKQIQAAVAPCRINIPKNGGTRVTITFSGPVDRIEKAQRLIQQLLDQKAQRQSNYLALKAERQAAKTAAYLQRQADKARKHQEYLQRQAAREQRHREYLERVERRRRNDCLEENTIVTVRRAGVTMSLAAHEVQVGDLIWDGTVFTPVLLAKLHEPRDLVSLTLSTGLSLTATGNHVVLRADGSEARLDNIVAGDCLLTTDTTEAWVEAVGAASGRPMELITESRRICVGAPLHVETRRGGVVVADSACSIQSKTPTDSTAEPRVGSQRHVKTVNPTGETEKAEFSSSIQSNLTRASYGSDDD